MKFYLTDYDGNNSSELKLNFKDESDFFNWFETDPIFKAVGAIENKHGVQDYCGGDDEICFGALDIPFDGRSLSDCLNDWKELFKTHNKLA